jgi:GNAT superfamily N-acetyltransferase
VLGFETFCRVRTEAHELPAEVQPQAEADLRGWRDAPGAHLYLALVEGVPAATAALSVSADGVGYLADGATLPAFRRRGLQATLIHRRLTDAAAAGCDVACSQATFAGTSHRNLQREGLVGGFTKAVWRGTQARGGH